MREIVDNGVVLARLIEENDIQPGLNFYSKDSEFIQVGAWNYDAGTNLNTHIHNVVKREVARTYEVLYIISGSIQATIYNLEEELIETFCVKQGDILILLDSGHGYQILEDDTKVLEIKNGPYLGAEIDRRRF